MAGVVCGAAQNSVLGEKPHRERFVIKGQKRYGLEAVYMGGPIVTAFEDIASLLAAVLCAVVDGASAGVVTHKHAALANAMGTGVQMWHRDGRAKEVLAKTDPSHRGKRTRPEPHPFSAVIAFQENTVLHVVKGSHNRGEENDFSQDAPHEHHVTKGYAAVFYSILVHRGMGTDGDCPSENIRGHMYLTVAGCTLPPFGEIEANIKGPEAVATATASTPTPAAATAAATAATPADAAQAANLAPAAVAATTAAAAAHEYTDARTGITLEKGFGGMDDAGTGTGAGSGGTPGAVSDAGTNAPEISQQKMPPVASDHTRAQFVLSIANLEKDNETHDVLTGLFDAGCILDGVKSFVEGGEKDSGRNNGMFSCFLGMNKESVQAKCYRDHTGSFWSNGLPRKSYTERVFIACMKARIPLVIEGDAPALSPMAKAMIFAYENGVAYLGYIGKKSGRGPLKLDPKLNYNWDHATVSDRQLRDTLNGGTFTIDNLEVDKKTGPNAYATMKNDDTTAMIREGTRMGELCFPRRPRSGSRGGKLTGCRADGVEWSGSECMFFAKDGGMTNPHIDVQSVPGGSGRIMYMPAAGVIRRVNHQDVPGPAKQAIVVHADDMYKVIETLKIDTRKESTGQYGGNLTTLPELARELREAGIRFVAMDFPGRCSYALPAQCAHVFITRGLVESAAWHPVFKEDMPYPKWIA
ncbi:unnamed protein product [Ectocarpus sp. 12 AP-2014]